MERLLDIEELSEILGVTKATIYSWTSQNKIPHIKLSRRLLKFRKGEIMEWIKQKSVSADVNCSLRKKENKKRSGASLNIHDDHIEKIIKNAKEQAFK